MSSRRRCLLYPCPGCDRVRFADEGHHLCRECEGYASEQVQSERDAG